MEGWYDKSEVIPFVELTFKSPTNGSVLPYSHLGVMIPVMTAKAATTDSTIHRMFLVVIITYISPILLLESLLTRRLVCPLLKRTVNGISSPEGNELKTVSVCYQKQK